MGDQTRIDGLESCTILVLALFFDILIAVCQLSIFLSPLSFAFSAISFVLFGFWFYIHGAIRFSANSKTLGILGISEMIKNIPGFGLLPSIFGSCAISIFLHNRSVKKEEELIAQQMMEEEAAYWN